MLPEWRMLEKAAASAIRIALRGLIGAEHRMDNNSARSSRLDVLLAEIAKLTDQEKSNGVLSLTQRHQDIKRAARILVEIYGDGAIERARLMEDKQEMAGFARAVRREVETLCTSGMQAIRVPQA